MFRVCLLAIVALVLSSPAHGRALLQTCSSSTCQPQSAPWSRGTVITDPNKDCSATENTCCRACIDYRSYTAKVDEKKYEWAYSGNGNQPETPPDIKQKDHFLVLPSKPCRGVEDWNKPSACHYEYIWDAAWKLIKGAGLERKRAMAINSQHTRTQHQMHVHVSDIQRHLGEALDDLAKNPDGKWHQMTCTSNGDGKNPLHCSGTTGNVNAMCKGVQTGMGPSDATPFETVYTHSYDPNTMSRYVTLVYSPKDDIFCIVRVEDRPAECLLYCEKDCSGKVGTGCP